MYCAKLVRVFPCFDVLVTHCRRNRALQVGDSPYTVHPDSLVIQESGCLMELVDGRRGVVLKAEISALRDNGFRVRINEKSPIRPRYQVEGALVGEPELQK